MVTGAQVIFRTVPLRDEVKEFHEELRRPGRYSALLLGLAMEDYYIHAVGGEEE
jgi:hypothetical protein